MTPFTSCKYTGQCFCFCLYVVERSSSRNLRHTGEQAVTQPGHVQIIAVTATGALKVRICCPHNQLRGQATGTVDVEVRGIIFPSPPSLGQKSHCCGPGPGQGCLPGVGG